MPAELRREHDLSLVVNSLKILSRISMPVLSRLLPNSRCEGDPINRLQQLQESARRYEYELTLIEDAEILERSLEIRSTSWANRSKLIRQDDLSESDESVNQLDENHLIAAAALGSEAIRRTLGFRLHDVQVRGAIATALGAIIEMQTGEGKTVVCGLAAYIRSIFDTSVHVATTNDYLAERDHQSVAEVFKKLGTSSAVIQHGLEDEEIHVAYRCNITYGPGYLFGFDYLRDQIKIREMEELVLGRDVLQLIGGKSMDSELSQPEHCSIIVDEADSVLIDESTTPLILSGGATTELSEEEQKSEESAYQLAKKIADEIRLDEHFTKDDRERRIELTLKGVEYVHHRLKLYGKMYLRQPWPTYLENALFAKFFLVRDENYVIRDDKIQLVDQFTGRIFEDRNLRGGLHQAVEAKEKLPINPPNRILARVTRQRFFQLYETVCGMTGTASGSEDELEHFYSTPVVPLPPNRPNKRVEHPDRFFENWDAKLDAIANEVERLLATGQPILIGTRTIRESELIDQALRDRGIQAVILNGIQDEEEADIVAKAGQPGALTIATNMAGRGTDIKLPEQSRSAGGLHVICSQRHVSRRIDRQLAGRSARQGDPGSCQFFISPDDELLEKHDLALGRKIASSADASGECHVDYSEEIAKLQQKIERQQFELRRKLVQQDHWMDQIRATMASE